MHKNLLFLAVLAAMLPLPARSDTVPPFAGNDTGGIIAWSPLAHRHRHEIAADHCARFNKIHRITSVHAWYGDYIGFACYWPRNYEPGGVIIRRSY